MEKRMTKYLLKTMKIKDDCVVEYDWLCIDPETIHTIDIFGKKFIDEKVMNAESVKHGKWVAYEFGNERWHKCSACGKADEYINDLGLEAVRNYCPNCGAKMSEKESDHE